MERERHAVGATPETATDPAAETTAGERARYTATGQRPPVAAGAHDTGPSASDRAFGPHAHGAHQPHHTARATNEEVMANELEVDGAAIDEASAQYGIPSNEIRAIITQESRGDATANAGECQRDHGKHAASGLMQVTEESWKQAQRTHEELAKYDFATHRYDRKINILVGTAVLADKRKALVGMGMDPKGPHMAALTSMAYNAGEGLVSDAYRRAREAGSKHPDADCLKPEYLKPAIRDNPQVYAYYLTGGGKSRNPSKSVDGAVELKYEEISRYPSEIATLLAEDEKRAAGKPPIT